MHQRLEFATRWLCLLPALLLGLTSLAHAQITNLDKGTLIKGLADEGMSNLLLHLIETDPPADPIEAMQVKIGQQRIQYLERVEEANQASDTGDLELAQQLKTEYEELFEEMVAQNREMIEQFRDHELRPIWQTDLADLMLNEWLQGIGRNAGEFYEFGVPTAQQREMYETTVAEAYALLVDADSRFFTFQGELPKRPDHTAMRINTGLWERMMEQYWKRRTQYFLAQAGLYTALLPEDHVYFQTLREHPLIPAQLQKESYSEEVQRIVLQAAEKLQPFAEADIDQYGIRNPSRAMYARALTLSGQTTEGLEVANQVTQPSVGGLLSFLGHLAAAQALHAQKQTPQALSKIEEAESLDLVKRSPLLLLLATDARHRMLLDLAETKSGADKTRAKEQAYQPYLDFLDNPALGDAREPLKNYIYKRWTSSIPVDQDLSSEPALVVAAIGEMSRAEGQNLWAEGYQLQQLGDIADGEELQEQAQPKLQRSVAVLTPLLERESLTDGTRAKAMYNLGWATYFIDPLDPEQVVKATTTWTDLADTLPDQPDAERAISNAAELLQEQHQNLNTRGISDTAYQRAIQVLFEKYPASDAAANVRLYHALTVLAPQAEYLAGAELLTKIPADHSDYFVSQGVMIEMLRLAWESAEGDEKQQLAQRILKESNRVEQVVAGDSIPSRRASGEARIARAQVLITQENTREALAALENFEEEFAVEEELAPVLRVGLATRITALVQAGQLEQAVKQAEAMMEVFPEDAAAVIDTLLADLEPQIDQLQRQAAEELVQRKKDEFNAKARSLSEAAEQLATMLLRWSNTLHDEDLLALYQVEVDDPFAEFLIDRAPFKISVARSKVLNGDPQGALLTIETLHRKYDSEADILLIFGNAKMALGGRENLLEAAGQGFDKIIGGVGPDQATGQYPPIYWDAWVKRLTISDLLGEAVEDIPVRVNQLQGFDANLGGEPYRSALIRLKNKHAQ